MQQINRRLDSSAALGKLLNSISKNLAAKRGLPLLVGAGLTVVSAIVMLVVMIIITSQPEVGAIWLLLCLPAGLLHLAVFIGFVGTMMLIPLGQSYGD